MSSANNDCSIFGFLFYFSSLFSLGLPKLHQQRWQNCCPYVVPDLRENAFKVFTVECELSCGFVIYGLYNVELGSLYAQFLESLYRRY